MGGPQQPPVPPRRAETEMAVLLPEAQQSPQLCRPKMAWFLCVSASSHCTLNHLSPIAQQCYQQLRHKPTPVNSTHDCCCPHSHQAQRANHPGPLRTGQPPTAPAPLTCPDTGVQARISCDDSAGERTNQTREHQRWQHEAHVPDGVAMPRRRVAI